MTHLCPSLELCLQLCHGIYSDIDIWPRVASKRTQRESASGRWKDVRARRTVRSAEVDKLL